MVIATMAVILGGLWLGGQAQERRRLLVNLQTYAVSHPQDAAVANVVIDCNKRVYVNVDACGAELLKQFGPGVLETLERMQVGGAFGQPLPGQNNPAPVAEAGQISRP